VIFFYTFINLHIYTFVDLYILNHAMKGQQSLWVSILMILVGVYLHMRVFICYTLSMSRQPTSIVMKKRDKLNYERLRDDCIKEHPLSERDINSLRMYKSDYATLARDL
jgi:hypothetical protein